MPNQLAEKIRNVVAPAVTAAGYELVDVEWKHETGGWVCRILLDKPNGIAHQDCERMSRELSPLLDVNDVIPHAYSLEVSSPGLNRPLRSMDHFRRFVGNRARVRLREGIAGRRNFTGRIADVVEAEEKVVLEVDGQPFALPIADVEKANLEYEFK